MVACDDAGPFTGAISRLACIVSRQVGSPWSLSLVAWRPFPAVHSRSGTAVRFDKASIRHFPSFSPWNKEETITAEASVVALTGACQFLLSITERTGHVIAITFPCGHRSDIQDATKLRNVQISL